MHHLDYSFRGIDDAPFLRPGTRVARFGCNHLCNLPPDLPTTLTHLYLNCNHFTNFPPAILGLVNLEVLILSNNPLINVDPAISGLTRLHTLNVGATDIVSLPAMPASLRQLDAAYARNLISLPPNLISLHHLVFLDIRFTRIRTLPRKIGLVRSLRDVIIDKAVKVPPSAMLLDPTLLVRGWFATRSHFTRLYWEPDFHPHFPPEFKRFVCVFTYVSRQIIPTELIWYILSFLYTTHHELHGGLPPRRLAF